jgi:hypothetical protein
METFLLSGMDISAFNASSIPHETIVAYLAADYWICGDWPFVLRVGQRSDKLAALYQRYNVATAAMLTAWHPYSEPRSDAENEIAQSELISKINRLGLLHQPGHGSDPTGQWPTEPSRLVLGLDLLTAELMGREFSQNGVVWVADNAVPTLVLLR